MRQARRIYYKTDIIPEVHDLDLGALRAAGAPALSDEQGEQIRGILNRLVEEVHHNETSSPVTQVRRRLQQIHNLASELAEIARAEDPASEAARSYVPALEEIPLEEIVSDAKGAAIPLAMKGAPNTTGPIKAAVSDLLLVYREAGGTGKAYRDRESEKGEIVGPFLAFVQAAVSQAQAVTEFPLYWSEQSLAEIVLKTPEP